MKLTFVSNFLNHHQLPICLELSRKLGDDFCFVATESIPKERLELGYQDLNDKYKFVVCAYEDKKKYEIAINLAESSDVVILGSAPEEYIRKRVQEDKLTFRYSERIFKNGIWRSFNPKTQYFIYQKHTKNNGKRVYMLCASAFTSKDLKIFGAYKNKFLKWGYFPKTILYDVDKMIEAKKTSPVKIIWVGSFNDVKHPEIAIDLARRLKTNGSDFYMELIGAGELRSKIQKLIKLYDLDNSVVLSSSMSPEMVRVKMEKSSIFIFTSDRREGWGAVLNEAMNSGCAVIANNVIGSVPYLIKHLHNGIIYKNNNRYELYVMTKMLIDNYDLRCRIGKNAYLTIVNLWNSEVAVNNLLNKCYSIIDGNDIYIEEGPCSNA